MMKPSATPATRAMARGPAKKTPKALLAKRLPDHIRPGLLVLFVGINPGLRSAAIGRHFAGHSNRFWKLLFESQLVSEPLTCQDDWRLPDWGLGLTNIVQRPSAGIDVLKPSEYAAGRKRLAARVQRYQPHVVALLGSRSIAGYFRNIRPERSAWDCRARFWPAGRSLSCRIPAAEMRITPIERCSRHSRRSNVLSRINFKNVSRSIHRCASIVLSSGL